MIMKGQVLNSSEETKELVGKDGTKRKSVVKHVLLSTKGDTGVEIVNVRSYDAEWKLPEVGKDWTTPRIRRYENFDGMVAEVSV